MVHAACKKSSHMITVRKATVRKAIQGLQFFMLSCYVLTKTNRCWSRARRFLCNALRQISLHVLPVALFQYAHRLRPDLIRHYCLYMDMRLTHLSGVDLCAGRSSAQFVDSCVDRRFGNIGSSKCVSLCEREKTGASEEDKACCWGSGAEICHPGANGKHTGEGLGLGLGTELRSRAQPSHSQRSPECDEHCLAANR